jgi:hypothetical protein
MPEQVLLTVVCIAVVGWGLALVWRIIRPWVCWVRWQRATGKGE